MDAGVYDAHVHDISVRTSKTPNRVDGKFYDYLNWEFMIDGPKYAGRHQWMITSLAPNGLWKLQQVLMRLGATPESLASVAEIEPRDYIGKKCRIQVGQEQYNGQATDRVQDLFPPAEAEGAAAGAPTLFR